MIILSNHFIYRGDEAICLKLQSGGYEAKIMVSFSYGALPCTYYILMAQEAWPGGLDHLS